VRDAMVRDVPPENAATGLGMKSPVEAS